MGFDQSTRNRLARFVSDTRRILTDEFTRQCQQDYGIDPRSGAIAELGNLAHLNDTQRSTARILRETIEHYIATSPAGGTQAAVERLVREQAFTVLNRLAALRMAEARGIIIESVSKGYQSKGFQLYSRLAGSSLGETGSAYACYLFSTFDDLALDLAVLFDRFSPQGRLFPNEAALSNVLAQLNSTDLDLLWVEDETIGWLYQYFNSQEERKKMREESAAPRNSRELAVRNQFFTPRYVVEFLTDNTLGRIWYEMSGGATSLKEKCRYLVRRPNEIFLQPGDTVPEQPKQDNLSQEDLLKQPVHIPHRPLKDPRTILMLDPACGSMHFGLYAFDLFEVIYDEAWALEEKLGADALSSAPGMKSLHATYAGKDAFLKDVPRLIIEHNLHGIDIDPRCAQIAGLSLWLRAQKAWQRLGLSPAQRPAIKRSNIVCAEPMPGEKELLREFVEREFPAAERPVCLRLLEAIFDKMQLAGEAGSLLKIEEEIRSAIEDARDAWQKLATKPQELFTTTELNQISTAPELTGLEQAVSSLTTDPRHLTTDFWERIEERIYAALRDYAEQAENGGGFQRRLFAEDAARGFAFIDVCRKRYDVALMNPPFGLCSGQTEPYLQEAYPNGWVDLYACFIWRGIEFTSIGRLGAITSRSFISSKKLEHLRASQLIPRLEVLADLGKGVMDAANVEACAYTLCSSSIDKRIWAVDLSSFSDREQRLANLVTAPSSPDLHQPKREMLLQLPNARILYSIPPRITNMLKASTRFEPTIGTVRCGLTTFDDVRFLRASWEVNPSEIGIAMRWEHFEKGGEYGNYYGDIHLVIKRLDNGAELASVNQQINGQTAQSRQASTYYYRPGSYYTDRSQRGFAARALPAGCVIAGNAPAILSESEISCLFLLGWLNARLMRSLVEMQAIDKKFYPGFVKALPWSQPSKSLVFEVEKSVSELLSVHGRYGARDETAPQFVQPWRTEKAETFRQAVERFAHRWSEDCARTRTLQSELSNRFDELYGVTDARAFAESILERDITSETTFEAPDALDCVSSMCHYLMGLSFGRWDIRYATGEQAAPELPDPFAPLPVCPPGQLQNAQGLPLGKDEGGWDYPIEIPWDGILVDDPNHPLDLERRVREVIEIIWSGQEGGPTAEAIEHEACEILGVKSLRDYFRKPAGFFADHLKRYSKSRRQAPIYWPLSTASGSYTLWIYYHRLTDQTLFTAINDFIEPKLIQASADASRLRVKANRSTADETSLEELIDLEMELKEFRDELLRIAAFWKPNLNDGVLITASPLWKLFKLKPWQKKLKETWDELEAGEYDWAHLALTIAPARVRLKCKTDKSIAIAHGLENLYEEPVGAVAKKKQRKAKTTEPMLGDEID